MLQSLSSSYSWFENRIFCQTSWTQQIKIGLPMHVNSEIKPLTDRFEKKKKKSQLGQLYCSIIRTNNKTFIYCWIHVAKHQIPRGALNGALLFYHHFWKRLGPQTGHWPNFMLLQEKAAFQSSQTSPGPKWVWSSTFRLLFLGNAPSVRPPLDPVGGCPLHHLLCNSFSLRRTGWTSRVYVPVSLVPHPTTLYIEAHCASASVNHCSH